MIYFDGVTWVVTKVLSQNLKVMHQKTVADGHWSQGDANVCCKTVLICDMICIK